jgi:hypothetical protein
VFIVFIVFCLLPFFEEGKFFLKEGKLFFKGGKMAKATGSDKHNKLE